MDSLTKRAIKASFFRPLVSELLTTGIVVCGIVIGLQSLNFGEYHKTISIIAWVICALAVVVSVMQSVITYIDYKDTIRRVSRKGFQYED